MTSTTNNGLVLKQSNALELLTHMAGYGFAAIVEASTSSPPTLSWVSETSEMEPRLCITHESHDAQEMAEMVRSYAERLNESDSWVHKTWKGIAQSAGKKKSSTKKGLMAARPPQGNLNDETIRKNWEDLRRRRHQVLKALVDALDAQDAQPNASEWLDLLFLWSLGELCYWVNDKDGPQGFVNSRLDLQIRNGGKDIIERRVMPLVKYVAGQKPEEIVKAFLGEKPLNGFSQDNGVDNRGAVGFGGLGLVDGAITYCAIWGISQFALNRSRSGATTAGYIRHNRQEWICVPVWEGEWTPARLRTILASSQFYETAKACIDPKRENEDENRDEDQSVCGSRSWLAKRGVTGLITFEVKDRSTTKARDPRAQHGVDYRLQS